MKRPIPVILSAILFGLLALLQLLAALLMLASGFMVLHKNIPGPPQPYPLPAAFLPITMFAMCLFSLALVAWLILTLIGLVRLRAWARYSTLIIAGCMTFFGGTAALMSIAMPILIQNSPTQTPDFDPSIAHSVFFFIIGAFYGIFAALGIALLVYFNLSRVRALFLQNDPPTLEPPKTSTGRRCPTAIAIIGWLFLITGPFCLIGVFLPFPAFLFGVSFIGWASHVLYIIIGLFATTLGYGLLRLYNAARIALYGWIGFGLLHMLVMLTPWGLHRFRMYMNLFIPQTPTPFPAQNLLQSTSYFVVCFVIGAAFNVLILSLVHRHREAFTPAPPPPPMPVYEAPLAE